MKCGTLILQFTLSCWEVPMSSLCADAIIACLGRFVFTGIHLNARIQGGIAVIGFNVVVTSVSNSVAYLNVIWENDFRKSTQLLYFLSTQILLRQSIIKNTTISYLKRLNWTALWCQFPRGLALGQQLLKRHNINY